FSVRLSDHLPHVPLPASPPPRPSDLISFSSRLDHHPITRREQLFRKRVNLLLEQRFPARQLDQRHTGFSAAGRVDGRGTAAPGGDRKSTPLNSSHQINSTAVYYSTKQ